ncbi:MAG: phosphopantetheine-binding protein [Deltaproteobacteria bacterium]|nr:phosphopantetheine-binding protein [Deltaproteobacteria bacterium]
MLDKKEIRLFIQTKIMKEGNIDDFKDTDSLIETGIIDSLGIQILLAYLEKAYSIKIADEELTPENFENIDAISVLVQSKTTAIR